ncbi:UNVERIFIED_CONTAM: ABC transporter substrate-binding protein [Microbacterium sp. SLM126]
MPTTQHHLAGRTRSSLMRRAVTVVAATAATLLAVAGCSAGTPTTPTNDTSEPQTIGASVAFDALDPHLTSNGITISINWYVFESLFQAKVSDPTSFYPALAAGEPEQVDDTTYNVDIREGATFHDGSPVTAEDVAASFERVINLADKSVLQKYLVNFDTVTAADEDTVTFKLKTPTAIFQERTSTVRIMPASIAEGPADSEALTYKPIGSGPYMVDSADPQTGAELVAYEDYNGPLKGKFSTDHINFKVIPDSNARVSALQTGEVNLIGQAPYNALETFSQAPYETAAPDSLSTHIVFVNASAAPFDNVLVRQALNYAIDKQEIADVAYEGYASVADSLVPESNADYGSPEIGYTFDPEKAKELLAEAGYPDGGVKITLQVPNEAEAMTTAGQLLQTQLDAAGFEVEILPGDTGSLYENVGTGNFQAMYAGTSPALLGSADADFIYRWLYYGSFIRDYTYWTDAEMEQIETLLDQAASAPTKEEYQAAMNEVYNIAAESGPIVPVVHPAQAIAWNAETTPTVTPSPIGLLVLAEDA